MNGKKLVSERHYLERDGSGKNLVDERHYLKREESGKYEQRMTLCETIRAGRTLFMKGTI